MDKGAIFYYNSHMNKTGGRPPKTQEDLAGIVRELEPYLKQGLSIKKACQQAKVSWSTVYDYYSKDTWFSDQIDTLRAYKSVLVSNIFSFKLELINAKMEVIRALYQKLSDPDMDSAQRVLTLDQIQKMEATVSEVEFLKWVAVNDKTLREEYGLRTEVTGENGAPLGVLLDSLEKKEVPKTDYEQLGQQASRQMVALNAPIQDKDEERGLSDVSTEHNATTPLGAEGGEQTEPNS